MWSEPSLGSDKINEERNMKNRIRLAISGFLVLVVAFGTFFAVSTLVSAQDVGSANKPPPTDSWNASSLDDSSKIAGYQVKSPKWIPDNFKQDSIVVTQLLTDSKDQKTRPTQIEWIGPDESRIILVQLPGGSVPRGEAVQVAGVTGVKLFYETVSGRPSVIALYWQGSDRMFCLGGMLTESLTQDQLLDIAASIEP
jgi:hypothetical protein